MTPGVAVSDLIVDAEEETSLQPYQAPDTKELMVPTAGRTLAMIRAASP